jgi:hypothetical protein
MDKQGFRAMLQARKLAEAQIEASISIAERFEAYLSDKAPTAETALAFAQILIGEGGDAYENCIALYRYYKFSKKHAMYIAVVELIDAGEVSGNLHWRIGKTFGEQVQNDIYNGFGILSFETPQYEKARYMHTILGRLENRVGSDACKKLLATSLRNLPDVYYLSDKEEYLQCKDINEYLERRRQAFLSELENCKRDGAPFYSQEVTDEVINFLRSIPEIRGARQGNVIYEIKEPYQTKQYLAETDPVLKRYYACHCPWVREAIKRGDVKLIATFCNCSAGYHKRPWEVIFRQPLKAEVVESVLNGDDRCQFAIYLPEDAITGN